MSNFAMGTITGIGFAQAQLHTNHSMSAKGTSAVTYARVLVKNPFPRLSSMAKLHSLIVTLIKKKLIKICQIASFMSTMGK